MVFSKEVEQTLVQTCEDISQRYEIHFLEIGTDEDHVHFLVQSVPMISVSTMVRIIKSITAKEIFKQNKEVKQMLWGGKFWTSGYYVNTVGKYKNEEAIRHYVRSQRKNYKQLNRHQPTLFEGIE